MENGNEALREKDQVSRLRSGNVTAILSTINEIRKSGKVSILPVIFEILADGPDERVYSELLRFLNDIKDKEAIPFIIDAIGNSEYVSIRKELVAACWQNNLGYSSYTGVFIEQALNGSYEVAIEAFTVIEDSIGELSQEERKKLAGAMRKKATAIDDVKQPLIQELIRMIESF
ncbi:MAG: hypothetical protein ACOYXB_08875 [Bacteroidota bacterium]